MSLLSLAFYWWILIGLAIALIVALIVVIIILVPMQTWFRALVSGAHIGMLRLVGMKLRKVDYKNM